MFSKPLYVDLQIKLRFALNLSVDYCLQHLEFRFHVQIRTCVVFQKYYLHLEASQFYR